MRTPTLALMLTTLLAPVVSADRPATHPADRDEYLVGIYYFSGWWRAEPNKYVVAGRDWREDFPERRALLGEYNDPETMDSEIVAAAEHGVDFFQILWYPRPDPKHPHPHHEKLNVAVEQFMNSPNAGRMAFTIEYVNHPPFDLVDDDAWHETCVYWAKVMRHPSYLRIDGRAVFKVHGLHLFHQSSGQDHTPVRERLNTLRETARTTGAGEILISAGVPSTVLCKGELVEPYDFLTTYMEVPNLPQRDPPYPYDDLLKAARDGWQRYGQSTDKPYMPFVPAGWDPRPWKDPRPSFELPDRLQWTAALRSVKTALDAYPKLGIPSADGSQRKALIIYAWNEFGEGGIVAPTSGQQMMKLQAIRDVFGRAHNPMPPLRE